MREMHNLSSETRDKGSEGKPRVGCMDFARVPVDMSILPRISFDTQSISVNRRFDVHDTPEVRVLLSHGPTEIMDSTHAREMYGTGTINYALSPRFRVPPVRSRDPGEFYKGRECTIWYKPGEAFGNEKPIATK